MGPEPIPTDAHPQQNDYSDECHQDLARHLATSFVFVPHATTKLSPWMPFVEPIRAVVSNTFSVVPISPDAIALRLSMRRNRFRPSVMAADQRRGVPNFLLSHAGKV